MPPHGFAVCSAAASAFCSRYSTIDCKLPHCRVALRLSDPARISLRDQHAAPLASPLPVPRLRAPPARPGVPRLTPPARRGHENRPAAEAAPGQSASGGSGWPGSGGIKGGPRARGARHRGAVAAAALRPGRDQALRPADRGPPAVHAEIQARGPRTAAAHPLGGAPRIQGEGSKLGITVAERSGSPRLPMQQTTPASSWRDSSPTTSGTASPWSFSRSPASVRGLVGLVVLAPPRRRVVHFPASPPGRALHVGSPRPPASLPRHARAPREARRRAVYPWLSRYPQSCDPAQRMAPHEGARRRFGEGHAN